MKTTAETTGQEEERGPGRTRLFLCTALGLAAWLPLYLGLEPASKFVVRTLLRLPSGSRPGAALQMFLYDSARLLLVLALVVVVMSFVRSFISTASVRRALAGRGEVAGGVIAALLGIFTPFCNCSAIPLFIGFLESGIPLGVTFSFLIAAPMVNEVAIAILINMFSVKVAGLYAGCGLAIAVLSGWTIGRLGMERSVEDWVASVRMSTASADDSPVTFEDRVRFALSTTRITVLRILPYVLAAILVGAIIRAYLPDGALTSLMGRRAWWSVPAAVIVGVPIYSNALGIMPVVQALMEKGAAPGTVLAFMMAVTALSLPEFIVLRRVIKPLLIVIFAGIVTAGILAVGFLMNAVL